MLCKQESWYLPVNNPVAIFKLIVSPHLKMVKVDFQMGLLVRIKKRIQGLEIGNTLVYSTDLTKFRVISECL